MSFFQETKTMKKNSNFFQDSKMSNNEKQALDSFAKSLASMILEDDKEFKKIMKMKVGKNENK